MENLLRNLGKAFPPNVKPPRLVRLPNDRPVLFVGDIHGDRDAVECIFSRFPPQEHVIVFLGDIVDRGPDSLGALSAIVKMKWMAEDSVQILMGNHEAHGVSRFTPADFWDSLPQDQSDELTRHLKRLPLAAWHPSGILAVHGGLPELPRLDAIDGIELGSEPWRAMTWGDWVGRDGEPAASASRPAFGPITFERRSLQLGIEVLVRSHQPSAPTYMFQDRCLTLFTSTAYGGVRQVARWMPGQRIRTARDLELIEI